MDDKPLVLLFVHNAGRSQMAAAFLTHGLQMPSTSAQPARNHPTG
jgi:hypothetical protein